MPRKWITCFLARYLPKVIQYNTFQRNTCKTRFIHSFQLDSFWLVLNLSYNSFSCIHLYSFVLISIFFYSATFENQPRGWKDFLFVCVCVCVCMYVCVCMCVYMYVYTLEVAISMRLTPNLVYR